MNCGFILRNQWFFKLPDPFRLTPYYPITANELVEMLAVSHKTALRICQGERMLKTHELVYLQMMFFGLIPDPKFLRHKYFFRDGVLLSYNNNDEIDISDAAAYAIVKQTYYAIKAEYAQAREKIKELETVIESYKNPLPPKPSNIIQFADYVSR